MIRKFVTIVRILEPSMIFVAFAHFCCLVQSFAPLLIIDMMLTFLLNQGEGILRGEDNDKNK